jgi:hypothetical protein
MKESGKPIQNLVKSASLALAKIVMSLKRKSEVEVEILVLEGLKTE